MSLFICLSACPLAFTRKPHDRTSLVKFFYDLLVAVARSSSDGAVLM